MPFISALQNDAPVAAFAGNPPAAVARGGQSGKRRRQEVFQLGNSPTIDAGLAMD